MKAKIEKEEFYYILKTAFEKGEAEPNVTVKELVEDLSVKLSGIVKKD
ncbi:hypothetical protein [Peribacillus sp. Hz7]